MTNETAALIDELRAARERATQGRWHIEDPMGDIGLSIVVNGKSPEAYDWRHIAMVNFDDTPEQWEDKDPITKAEMEANARFITLAYNSLPALLDEVDRLQKLYELYKAIVETSSDRITDANRKAYQALMEYKREKQI